MDSVFPFKHASALCGCLPREARQKSTASLLAPATTGKAPTLVLPMYMDCAFLRNLYSNASRHDHIRSKHQTKYDLNERKRVSYSKEKADNSYSERLARA